MPICVGLTQLFFHIFSKEQIEEKMSVSTTAIEMARKNQLHRFKLVLLGESGVGKTALVVRFVKNSFSDKFDSTIGGLLFLPTFWVDEKEQQLKPQQVKLEIWDTAGQVRETISKLC